MPTVWKKFKKTTLRGYGKSLYGKFGFGDATMGRNVIGNKGWKKQDLVTTNTVWVKQDLTSSVTTWAKQALTALLLIFSLSFPLLAESTTSLGLRKPDAGEVDWDIAINDTMDKIDALIVNLQNFLNGATTTYLDVSEVLPGGATSYIRNQNTLQSGSTFYVSSGTATNLSSISTMSASAYAINDQTILKALRNGIALGLHAGENNLGGNYNVFIGSDAGKDNTTESNNTFVGALAGLVNTTGNRNTFLGSSSGLANTAGTS